MAELQARIYLKPPKSIDLNTLRSLFTSDSQDEFVEVARDINPDQGDQRARDFLSSGPSFEEIQSGRTRKVRGFAIWDFVLGIDGVSETEGILEFLLDLVPAADAWAYVVTDDDPVETWFRASDGTVIQEENEPGQDSAQDREAIESIYAWWHGGLPKSIFEGQLIESRDEVPQPVAVEQVVTKTQVSGIMDICWENIFFNLILHKDDDREPDWQKPRRELSEEGAEKALRLLKALRSGYRRFDVDMIGHSGHSGSIKFVFSTHPESNNYPLNYAALCILCGGNFKHFFSTHSDHEVHYLAKEEHVVVEKRQGKEVLETLEYSIEQVLEILESDHGI